MSVLPINIKYYLTPSSNNDPLASLGGAGYGGEVGTALHGLFDRVKPAEAVAGSLEYRAIGVKNTNVTDTLSGAVLYISSETSSVDDTIAIAYDAGTQSVPNETTAPSSPVLTFATPLSKATGVALGDMAPGAEKRIWLRRTVTAGAGVGVSAGSLAVAGGTT